MFDCPPVRPVLTLHGLVLRLILPLVVALCAQAAAAQEYDRPWSRGGRVPSAEARLEAQDLAVAAGIACRVGQAQLRGQDRDGAKQYEVTCAAGPGYLLVGGEPPTALDCLALEASFRSGGSGNARCRIAANRDATSVVARLAAEAGIACRVDNGAVLGKAADGLLYEVGCAGADGYWLERSGGGWSITPCLKVVAQSGTCALTTAREQATTLGSRIAGRADCDVVDAAYRGAVEGTDLYEARCRSSGGVMVRFDSNDRLLAMYACAEATWIGGGCRF